MGLSRRYISALCKTCNHKKSYHKNFENPTRTILECEFSDEELNFCNCELFVES